MSKSFTSMHLLYLKIYLLFFLKFLKSLPIILNNNTIILLNIQLTTDYTAMEL